MSDFSKKYMLFKLTRMVSFLALATFLAASVSRITSRVGIQVSNHSRADFHAYNELGNGYQENYRKLTNFLFENKTRLNNKTLLTFDIQLSSTWVSGGFGRLTLPDVFVASNFKINESLKRIAGVCKFLSLTNTDCFHLVFSGDPKNPGIGMNNPVSNYFVAHAYIHVNQHHNHGELQYDPQEWTLIQQTPPTHSWNLIFPLNLRRELASNLKSPDKINPPDLYVRHKKGRMTNLVPPMGFSIIYENDDFTVYLHE